MSDFKSKKHQYRFRLRPRPRWGVYIARSPDLWLDLRGPYSKGRKENGKRKGRVGEGMEGERKTMTCLTTLVTWKWPGCFEGLAPPLQKSRTKQQILSLRVLYLFSFCFVCLCYFVSLGIETFWLWPRSKAKAMVKTWPSDVKANSKTSKLCPRGCVIHLFPIRSFELRPRQGCHLVDCAVWAADQQQQMYCDDCWEQLKQAVVDECCALSQKFIDRSINEWWRRLKCLVQQNGRQWTCFKTTFQS